MCFYTMFIYSITHVRITNASFLASEFLFPETNMQATNSLINNLLKLIHFLVSAKHLPLTQLTPRSKYRAIRWRKRRWPYGCGPPGIRLLASQTRSLYILHTLRAPVPHLKFIPDCKTPSCRRCLLFMTAGDIRDAQMCRRIFTVHLTSEHGNCEIRIRMMFIKVCLFYT